MAGQQQRRRMEQQIREWLDRQSDTVRYVSWSDKAAGESLGTDFLVLQPFPLAIEVVTVSSPQAMRMRAKRFLAQRLSLAERFGRFLPVILAVPEGLEAGRGFRFADLVIEAGVLPSLEDIRQRLSLDPSVQRIIETGDPGEVKFSESERVDDDWGGAIDLVKLSDEHADFPASSLAEALKEVLVPIRREVDAAHPPSEEDPNHGWSWFLRSRKWSEEFTRVLHAHVEQECGGKVITKRTRVEELGGLIQRSIWEAPNGARVVLRRLSVGGTSLPHKVPELVAEAWMTRSFAEDPINGQVLLLGGGSERMCSKKSIRGAIDRISVAPPPGIHYVNVLEGGGWNVQPWDFSRAEPSFIKHLKEVGND